MDYYQVLGVDRTASEQQIIDRYKELIDNYQKFKKVRSLTRYEEIYSKMIDTAYSKLKDQTLRKNYDKRLENAEKYTDIWHIGSEYRLRNLYFHNNLRVSRYDSKREIMDYYQVLGVDRNASEQEIINRYKELTDNNNKFKKVRSLTRYENAYSRMIETAYNGLKNSTLRKDYDKRLENAEKYIGTRHISYRYPYQRRCYGCSGCSGCVNSSRYSRHYGGLNILDNIFLDSDKLFDFTNINEMGKNGAGEFRSHQKIVQSDGNEIHIKESRQYNDQKSSREYDIVDGKKIMKEISGNQDLFLSLE